MDNQRKCFDINFWILFEITKKISTPKKFNITKKDTHSETNEKEDYHGWTRLISGATFRSAQKPRPPWWNPVPVQAFRSWRRKFFYSSPSRGSYVHDNCRNVSSLPNCNRCQSLVPSIREIDLIKWNWSEGKACPLADFEPDLSCKVGRQAKMWSSF